MNPISRISLDGEWQLAFGSEKASTYTHPRDLENAAMQWIPAQVPGNVELDMVRAGLLEEPFYADNIRNLRPLEYNEWWYRRVFTVSDTGAHDWDLVFAGLDTLATVWVNGIEVGRAANALIEQRFDVSDAVRPGETNTITVRIGSALNHARQQDYDANLMSWEQREEGVHLRKPPHCWGWDIMPRAVSAGLWRSVWLEAQPDHAIEQLYYFTLHANNTGATLGVRFQFRTTLPTLENLELHFHGQCGDHSFDFTWQVEFIAGGCRIPVPNAKLWWPKGYGDANLYTVTVQLRHGEEVLAERTERIGIRKLDLHRTEAPTPVWILRGAGANGRVDIPIDPQSHFYVSVNGQPVMVKGANWVPLDAFHSRDAARVDNAVALFDDLGCNMIRCWGGNVYEDHRFFDLCDEKGILVWQDFAFACCRYPQVEPFFEQVREEIESVAQKLRNHASLALWCGDNEVDMTYLADQLLPSANHLTRTVIPQVLQRIDPYRAYVPSSPYVPERYERLPNINAQTPERHLWGPRGYYKSPFYTQHGAHFIGEIGYHGCPNTSSIHNFISPEAVWPWQDNDEWQVHSVYHWQHHGIERARIALMASQVRELFGEIPETLEDFALASQITQAEAKKFFIETTRLRKWATSGILWWNVIDGWPQFSDAIVDYYFGKKLAYHYIRRVQHPVCAILGEAGPDKYLPLVISNDSLEDAGVTYSIREAGCDAAILEGSATIPANQNWQVGRIRTYASDQRLLLIEWAVNGQQYGNHYLAGTPPFSLAQYKEWLKLIANLPRFFDVTQLAQ